MKICFKSLDPIKKEANQLRKLIKKTIKTKINPQVSLDIVSKMYGWQHFNELSYVFINPGDAYPVQSDYLIKPDTDYRQITMLTDNERVSLEFRKRKVLEKELGLLHKDSEFIENILKAFFDDRSWLTKFMTSLSSDNTMMLSQFSDSTIRKNNLCIGANPEVQAEFYSKITASNAIENGGFYILRKSIADKFIPFMVDNMPKGEESRLKIVDTTAFDNERTVFVDLFKTETPDTIFESIISLVQKNDTGGDSGWTGACIRFIRAIKPLYEAIFGKEPGAFDNQSIDVSLDFLSYSAFIQYKNIVELNDLRNILFHSPGFEKDLVFKMKDQSPKVYENHTFLTMQFTEFLMTMKEDNELAHGFESVSIHNQCTPGANEIVIYVIHDDDIRGYADYLMFAAYLRLMSKKCFDLEVPSVNSFKPVVLDYYSRYMIRGSAVLAAQSRTLGYAYFYGMTNEFCFNRTSPEEAASIIANTTNRFIFKDHNELDINFTSPMINQKYGDIDFGNCNILYISSEFKSPDVIKIID